MSFNDRRPADLEAQPTTWRRQDDPEYQDDPEFNEFTTRLSDKLFSLTSNISRLSNQIALLGTRKETDRVRERVQDLLQETGDGFKEIGEGVKKVQSWHDMGPSQKYTSGKLGQEFRASLNEFQALQKQALSKQKASASAARVALDSEALGAEGVAGSGSQQQQQLLQQDQIRLADQSEVDFQESLIVERESEIRNIEQSVSELNELFRDVATMISDQGNQLDTIDVNVMNTRDDTRNADQQLRTASRHQKSARGRACCLLVILAIVLAVVILAIVL
jgi:syntaxin 7